MLKNILVAIDGSKASTNVLQSATELSEKFGAGLHLLHVVWELQIPSNPANPGLMGKFDIVEQQHHDLLTSSGEQLLNQAKRVAESNGASVLQAEISSGDPASEIVKYADKNQMDLIVIGSRGLGQVKGLLMGSVSRKVCNMTKVNCLIVN